MADVRSYTSDELTALLPLPEREANKYTRGVLFAVVGSAQYPGAACLAGTAGQRTGAGYTRVTTAPEAEDLVRSCSPSLVVRSFEGLAAADLPVARDGHPAACVVGCGFDPNDEKKRVAGFIWCSNMRLLPCSSTVARCRRLRRRRDDGCSDGGLSTDGQRWSRPTQAKPHGLRSPLIYPWTIMPNLPTRLHSPTA